MRDDEWKAAYDAGRGSVAGLVEALERINSGECVYDWADQPHEQMQDEAHAALEKFKADQ